MKLKIASGKRFIDFKTNGQFSIIDQNGIVIEKNISTDLKWRLKVEYFKNERNSYSFMICLYRNKNFALNILNKLKKQNYDVRLQRIGGIIKIGNKKIESTFYRVLIGEYNCIKDALNSNCYKMLEFNPSIICEKVSKPKAVFELCDENINRVFKIKNSIQIITNNSHTNTLIYNVLNDEDKIEKEVLKVFGDIEFNIGKNKTINILKKISLEKYLKNIIYHELGSDFHLEILKSQAVLSRGTILLNMSKLNDEDYDFSDKSYPTFINSSKDVLNKIEQAVMKTKGEVLIYNNNLCRTPYCKSCGGYLNNNYFFYRDTLNKYLKRGLDTNKVTGKKSLSLRSESKIEKWINDKPDVLCNPKNFNSENPFIKENNFFRWNISFSRSELEEIIRSNGYGYDIGFLFDIIPIKRNYSGRIIEIEILGSRNNLKFNNEYTIYEFFSNNKLPSNCFVIEKEIGKYGIPAKFIFRGAGKGNGMGLCQSGAEVLAERNKNYKQILEQYFNDIVINKIY